MSHISNTHSYNKIADQWTKDREKSFVSKRIMEFVNQLKPAGYVLDLGCGSGVPNALYLSEKGFHVHGIDASSRMIELAKAHHIPNATFELADILEFELSTTFEGILAWDSIFHLPYNVQHSIFLRISRWMMPGGWFLFTYGGKDGEIEGEMYGEKFYYSALANDTVRQLLTESGFEIHKMFENYRERDMDRDLVVLAVFTKDTGK